MEKVIKLYNYVDGVSDTPFPSKEEQVEISAFEYNASRMGGAPSINAKVKHRLCLDDLWNDNVYALFNGERFFIMNTPSSSKDNRDERYEHDLQLLSEREVLNHVFFIDAVRVGTDTQVSSGTKFQFVGSLSQFIGRLNSSLSNSGVGYSAVLDEGMDTEDKMISFEDKYVMEALQEAFRAYEMPYYFKGRVIHFGLAEDIVGDPIRYGAEDALIAVGKNNANYKVINRISGMGSEDNIPYYYPNDSDNRAEIEANGGRWITPSTNLMPSVYRESLGKERFYNALNGTYPTPEGGFYEFNNPFVQGKPLESIVDFPEIKPTIKEITNALGYRIDMFSEFAYDTNDNDEVDKETNEYIHPYFFGKLRKMDGEFAFNLFDQANEKQAMTISMTSGVCASCNFEIGVGEETEKNIVQVDERGNLLRDEEGNVKRSGQPQDRQNDTKNYEVWVALKKDTETYKTFGVMPNAERNLRPSAGDTFVILGISLPKAYILAAEKRLDDSLIKYMFMNNDEKFSFSAKFSRIYFTERPHALQTLNENSRILLEYNGKSHPLYVDDFSYKVNAKDPLPEIEVNLTDTLTIGKNSLQNALDSVKKDILSSIGGGDFLKQGLKYFLRKDVRDTAKEVITFAKGVEIGKFKSGTSGGIFGIEKKDEKGNGGASFAEVDKLRVRMKAYFEQLEIVNVNSVGGKMIISPAGSIKVSKVEDTIDGYKCFFLAEQDGEKIENRFIVGDQGYCQLFNARKGVENKVSNKRYWRLVVGVGEDYIILSKTDADTASDIPSAGDVICQLGNRTDVDRQNALVFSAVDTFSPMITLYQGISSYTLLGKDAVSYGVDKRSGKAFFYAYGDMFVGDRPIDGQSKTYLKYTQEKGVQLKGNIHIESTVGESGDKLEKFLKDFFKEDFDNLQNQIDGKIESWFANGVPSLNNYPASEWTDDKTKNLHLGDLYYDRNTGSSYRFELAEGEYRWSEIIDTEIQEALRQAAQAQATADGKMQVFSWNGSPLSTSDSYQIGDLWVNVTYKVDEKHDYKDEILRAKDNKESGQPFSWNHWTRASGYTDDTVAKDALGKVEKAQESLNKLETTVKGMRDFTDNAFTDGIFDEGELAGFKNYLKQIDTFVEQVDKTFADVYKNPLLDGLPKTNLNTSHNSFTTATTELVNAINDAIKDKRGTTEEKALVDSKYTNFNLRYGEYSSALSVANSYIQSKLDGKIDQVQKDLGGYAFLKKVFREETSITGGLVQTTTVALGYTETAEDGSESYKIMAGTNGLYDKSKRGGGLSAWYGGGMYDFFDYYRYNEDTQDFEQIQEIPQGATIAKSADRFDGTGYRANGKLWWENDGNLHADPLSFFVGESTVGGLLASFQIVMQADGRHPSYVIPKVPFQKLTIADGLVIGKGKLVWDEENNAIKVVGNHGEVINFYSTGEVSAYGMGTSGGGGSQSYVRLDYWEDYVPSKKGWVLSAYLGNDLNVRVGDLSKLSTEKKDSLVDAINEVKAQGGGEGSKFPALPDKTNAYVGKGEGWSLLSEEMAGLGLSKDAKGIWGISISGNAATATNAVNSTNAVNATNATNAVNASKVNNHTVGADVPYNAVFTDENATWGGHYAPTKEYQSLKKNFDAPSGQYISGIEADYRNHIVDITTSSLPSADLSGYAKKDGSNASGTWEINITGSATSAATATNATNAATATNATNAVNATNATYTSYFKDTKGTAFDLKYGGTGYGESSAEYLVCFTDKGNHIAPIQPSKLSVNFANSANSLVPIKHNEGSDYTFISATRSDNTWARSLVDDGWRLQFRGIRPQYEGSNIATANDLSSYLPKYGGTLTGDLTFSNCNIELGTNWLDGNGGNGLIRMDDQNNSWIGAVSDSASVTVRSGSFKAPHIYSTSKLHTAYNYGMMCGLPNGGEDYILYYDSTGKAHLSYNSRGAYVDGSLVASGEVTAYSDARLKDNVKPLENRGFIEPKTYVKDGKESIGFLAQDVQKLYPELVKEDNSEEKLLSLNYAQMTAVLEAQIIEQKKEIDELKNMVNELKSMINNGIK